MRIRIPAAACHYRDAPVGHDLSNPPVPDIPDVEVLQTIGREERRNVERRCRGGTAIALESCLSASRRYREDAASRQLPHLRSRKPEIQAAGPIQPKAK